MNRVFLNVSRRVKYGSIVVLLVLLILYYFTLPVSLFSDPYSTVLQARGGELLTATIAEDGQWRFPQRDSVPEKFAKALIAYEDKRFHQHIGVDVRTLARAFRQNVQDGTLVDEQGNSLVRQFEVISGM